MGFKATLFRWSELLLGMDLPTNDTCETVLHLPVKDPFWGALLVGEACMGYFLEKAHPRYEFKSLIIGFTLYELSKPA